jgi:hypothetical protein
MRTYISKSEKGSAEGSFTSGDEFLDSIEGSKICDYGFKSLGFFDAWIGKLLPDYTAYNARRLESSATPL